MPADQGKSTAPASPLQKIASCSDSLILGEKAPKNNTNAQRWGTCSCQQKIDSLPPPVKVIIF